MAKAAKKAAPSPEPSIEGLSVSELVEMLASSSRRERQAAASSLSSMKDDPNALLPYGASFVDVLECREARTRWECLDILSALTLADPSVCDDAVPGAEEALFDEDSGPLRLAAFRFMCSLGKTSPERASRVWPFLDEATVCYHGDPEFQDMLISLVDFSDAELPEEVKEGLSQRMKFDAVNGKDHLQKRAQRILDNLA